MVEKFLNLGTLKMKRVRRNREKAYLILSFLEGSWWGRGGRIWTAFQILLLRPFHTLVTTTSLTIVAFRGKKACYFHEFFSVKMKKLNLRKQQDRMAAKTRTPSITHKAMPLASRKVKFP